MPRIIRSTGVNIERARPIVMPLREQEDEAAVYQPTTAAEQDQMDQIYASADLIVEEIISKARTDADNMLVDARQETMKVLQDAVREGWDQGMNEALREMRALQCAASEQINSAVDALRSERQQMIKDVELDILELVFDMVDKVLAVEMDRSTGWITSMVNTALQHMEGDEAVVMKVSAAHWKRVEDVVANMLSAAGKQTSRLTVVSDASMKPGGCIIETSKGIINTSVENKFDKLKTALRENA